MAATALGIIPAAFVYAFAGTGLDSVITAQKNALPATASPPAAADCHLAFDARDILTPQLLGALVALGLLALVPVVVKRLRARPRATDVILRYYCGKRVSGPWRKSSHPTFA